MADEKEDSTVNTTVNPKDKKAYLVGVTSRGEEPCNKTAVYSSVIGYSKWIDTTSKKIMQ